MNQCIKCGKPATHHVHARLRKKMGDSPFVTGPKVLCCTDCVDKLTMEDVFKSKDNWAWQGTILNVKQRMGFTAKWEHTTLSYSPICD